MAVPPGSSVQHCALSSGPEAVTGFSHYYTQGNYPSSLQDPAAQPQLRSARFQLQSWVVN